MAYQEKIVVSASGGSTAGRGVTFANSNGITFSNSNGSIVASHNALTQQSTQPVAISGSNGSFAFSTVTFGNLNGLSFYTTNGSVVGSYTTGGGGITNVNVSAGTTSQNLSNFVFSNSNGVSFGLNGSTITGSHNGLTTAAQSNHSHNFATTTTNGASIIVATTNSNGATIAVPAFLTTAAQSNHSHNLATTTTNGSLIVVATTNSAGATFAVPPYLTTAQAPGAYLTTARASNDGVGLNTAQTNVTWTVNSSGLSLNAAGYAGTGTSATNASITLNSNGLAISVAAPGGGGAINVSAGTTSGNLQTIQFNNSNGISFGLQGSTITATVRTDFSTRFPFAGGSQANLATYLSFHDSPNFSWQLSSNAGDLYSNSIVGTPYINFSAGTTSANRSNVTFSNANGVSFGLNAGTITASVNAGGAGGTATMWQPFNERVNVVGQRGQNSWALAPLPTPPTAAGGIVSIDRIAFPILVTNATNSTGTMTATMFYGLYTKNGASLSLAHSTSGSLAVTFSGTVNNSTYAGVRLMTIPWTTTFGDDRYYVAVASRTTTGGANCTVSQMLVSQINSNFSGLFGVNSNRSNQWPVGWGNFSSASTDFPNPIPISQIDGTASLAARPPSWFMINGTV